MSSFVIGLRYCHNCHTPYKRHQSCPNKNTCPSCPNFWSATHQVFPKRQMSQLSQSLQVAELLSQKSQVSNPATWLYRKFQTTTCPICPNRRIDCSTPLHLNRSKEQELI